MDRIRFITHREQRILLVDFTDCTAEEVATMADLCPRSSPRSRWVPFCCWATSAARNSPARPSST